MKQLLADRICPLCGVDKVGSQESHIIPKFFTKSMYYKNGKNQKAYIIGVAEGKVTSSSGQDILKEPYLFCTECESFLGVLDTHFCNQIYWPLRDQNRINKYFIIANVRHHIAFSEKSDKHIVYLFFVSLLLRCHFSNLSFCKQFYLEDIELSALRQVFIQFRTKLYSELTSMISNFKPPVNFSYLVFANANNTKISGTSNFVDVQYKSDSGCYFMVINDFVFSIYFSGELEVFADALNTTANELRIVILSDSEFESARNLNFNRYFGRSLE